MKTKSDALEVGSTYRSTVQADVVAEADVVVVGGGSAGVVAAIAAARQGAGVLLVERRGCLGGMMTGGNVGLTKYIVHENDAADYREVLDTLRVEPSAVQVVGGLPLEITNRLIKRRAGLGTYGAAGSYVFTAPEAFKLELLNMLQEAGVDLMLHSLFVDAVKEGGNIRGAVVENKSGRQVVLGRMFIDATGDADLAARAGAPFTLGIGPDDLSAKHGIPVGSLQRMGVMFRVMNADIERCLGFLEQNPERFGMQHVAKMDLADVRASIGRGDMAVFLVKGLAGTQEGVRGEKRSIQFYNTPLPGVFTCCCPLFRGNGLLVEDLTAAEIAIARLVDRWVAEMRASIPGFEDCRLLDCPEIGVRETRHVQGEYVLDIEDIYAGRDFEDTIGRGGHTVDISPIPPELADRPLDQHRWYYNIPYRSLVPRGIDNLLLAGRCISNTHEAAGCTRCSVQCMVTGEAAGAAAALCVGNGAMPRALDTNLLRRRLAEGGVVL